MNEAWKNPTVWAAGGATIGALAVVILNDNQVNVADHWAATIAAVAAGVAALAAAFRAALAKRK